MKTGQIEENDRARNQAQAQFESIRDMVNALRDADEVNDESAREEVIQMINEDPLSVQVRSGWHTPGERAIDDEYEILLCTGGPAVRIVGDLSRYGEPHTAKIEYQDWFTPWENYPLTSDNEEIVLTYARNFYFGD